jgi:UDP-N-acetylglucosamine 2-epimerase (non-hydrolysing)
VRAAHHQHRTVWIPVIHLEAGLRSRDRRMPEEINRLVTDAISDDYWVSSPDAVENLRSEGVAEDKIDFVGNIMIDSYELMRDQIERDQTRAQLQLEPRGYAALLSIGRPTSTKR